MANDIESNKGKHIILAEDSVVQRMALSAMLEHHGYRVDCADNGEEALRLLQSATLPDAVITDLGMPHMNGINLCRRIKEDPRMWHLPVIMLTSIVNEKNHDLGIEAGVSDFVTKPVSEQELIYRVNLALTSAATSREGQRGWYGLIFDALAQPVLVTDERGCYADANAALLELVGSSARELQRRPEESMIVEPQKWADTVPAAIADTNVWCGRVRLTCKSGASDLIDARATRAVLTHKQVYVWLLQPPPSSELSHSIKRPADASRYKPEEIVDAGRLYEMIGLRTDDPTLLSAAEHDRLRRFTTAVENAAAVRRIQRFARLDAKTGQVIGRGYVREELERIIRNRG